MSPWTDRAVAHCAARPLVQVPDAFWGGVAGKQN